MDVNILVHPFYGIVSIEGFYWAVMKDFREFKSLAMALQDAEWRAAKRYRDRVRIAYLISKTVAFLHSVDLLVKRLGDVSVVMVEQGGNEVPYLTGLEQARFVSMALSNMFTFARIAADEFITDLRVDLRRSIRRPLRSPRIHTLKRAFEIH